MEAYWSASGPFWSASGPYGDIGVLKCTLHYVSMVTDLTVYEKRCYLIILILLMALAYKVQGVGG